jgi:pimeloyl-ACP methyl ester carboxylesterase
MSHLRFVLKWIIGCGGLLLLLLVGMIVFGEVKPPPVLHSINDVAASVDRSDMPPIASFPARDGVQLAYRAYLGTTEKIAILLHGSSGSSRGMHALGRALKANGVTAFAVDVRGHGDSGARGDIAYIGQLEDDLADFVAYVRKTYPTTPLTLIGHSSGGGFALRVAGSPLSNLFAQYIVLAPYLRHDAPTIRPRNGGWVNASVSRIIGLTILHRLGIEWFSGLPVLAFAIPQDLTDILTGSYSYRLFANYRPHDDYLEDFRRSSVPITVLVGKEDELFYADQYEPALTPVKQQVRIIVIPNVGHMAIVSDPVALDALVRAYCTEKRCQEPL